MNSMSLWRIEKEGPWNWVGWLSVCDLEALRIGGDGCHIVGQPT